MSQAPWSIEKYQRGGVPTGEIPYIVSEWEDDGERYWLLAEYPEGQRTLCIECFHEWREQWETVTVPDWAMPAFEYWADGLLIPRHL